MTQQITELQLHKMITLYNESINLGYSLISVDAPIDLVMMNVKRMYRRCNKVVTLNNEMWGIINND